MREEKEKFSGEKEKENQDPKGTFRINVEGGFSCLLKAPNRHQLGGVIALLTPVDGQAPRIVEAGLFLLETCWISGDEIIRENDSLAVAAATAAVEIIEIKEATLVKN